MISLGGATDSAFLEGHSYTYEGSNWGRLAQILMDAKCMNPIIYFDELDKVSETKHGEEIIGVLTHLIDYSQNNWIQDRYFSGIPLDFSRCLFIFSFNDEYRINPILKDRIHIIRTDPSNAENKLVIAKDYLIPKLLQNVGFQREDILFPDATIQYIIQNFTNGEDGVRNLKRCLDSIILKLNTLRLTYQNPKLSSSPSTSIIPYYLNNYALPMTITVDVVDTLVKGTSLKQKSNEKLHMMYM
jgi:ATP-dependent Lon protease